MLYSTRKWFYFKTWDSLQTFTKNLFYVVLCCVVWDNRISLNSLTWIPIHSVHHVFVKKFTSARQFLQIIINEHGYTNFVFKTLILKSLWIFKNYCQKTDKKSYTKIAFGPKSHLSKNGHWWCKAHKSHISHISVSPWFSILKLFFRWTMPMYNKIIIVLCHKLKVSNLYILSVWWFKLKLFVPTELIVWNI